MVRVEVSPGDLYGSDYAGKSQVLNVVLSDAGGFDANVTVSVRRSATPSNCRYVVHWVGTKQGSANTIP